MSGRIENLRPWKPGQSGNPGGRPKNDVAAQLARDIIEGNYETARRGLAKTLNKGNAHVFKELADRGYGKLKERTEVTFKDTPDGTLDERIAQLERDLGLAKQIDAPKEPSAPVLTLPENTSE